MRINRAVYAEQSPPEMRRARTDSRLYLYFHISLNEEHTFLHLGPGPGWVEEIDLGERVHHYILLTLARQRLADARRAIDVSGQGWLETGRLSTMLGLDPAHLNIQLFRARRQLAAALPEGCVPGPLLERRRGEIRLADLPFHITRGSVLEGEFDPEPGRLRVIGGKAM